MAVDIGPKIGIEGESEFRRQIKNVNEQIKTLGTEMQAVEAAFSGQEKSTEALTAKSRVLTSEIDKQKDKLELLAKGLQESKEKYGENDDRTLKWQQAVNRATAELSKMENELGKTTDELKGEAKGADKAGDSTEEAGKKAEKSGDGWDSLAKVVAGAGAAMAAAAAAAGAAIGAAAKALTDFTVDGAAFADEILTMSSVTGMSTDKLQEMQYAAELVDVSVDTLTSSMRRNIQSMTKARNGNKDLTAVYDRLGVSVTNTDGSLRDSETVYWELINALGSVEDETERDSLAMQVLGRSAQDLNPLIEAGSEKMAALAEDAHAAGYVMGGDALTAFGEFDDQLQRLGVGATAAKNALGTVLLPVLTDLAGDGVDLLGEFTNGILDANGDISAMGDVVAEVLPQVLDRILEYVPELIELAGTLILSLAEALTQEDNLEKIMESAVVVFETLVGAIVDMLPELLTLALTTVTTLATDLLDPENIRSLIDTGITLLLTLIEGLTETLPELIPIAVEAILTIVDALTDPDNLSTLLDAALALIIALATGLIEALPELVAKVPEIIKNLFEALTDPDNLGKIASAALEIITALGQGLLDIWEDIKDVGGNIVSGIWEGISAGYDWIKEKITGWVDDVLGFFKRLLGIASPSKVFAEMGGYLSEGLALGIEGGVKDVKSAVGDLSDAAVSAWDAQLDPAFATAGIVDVRASNSGAMAASTVSLDAASLSALSAGRSGGGETIVNIRFTGSLAQLGRLLQPEIQTATALAGASLIS